MKIDKAVSTINRGGVQTESHFTVKATGKAFEILSAGLYTDPILAVIRELCCNAKDAHVAADEKNGTNQTDVPFLVHLPNRSEPYFEVTDYGIGMSEDDIMNIYTTYFESTKDESNSFIGALGLGSKSPFAYADSFQVVSRWNSTKTTYSIFFNEERVPSIARMGEVETTEPNGISVRVSVKENDYRTFETKTAFILKYFPVLPTVVGGTGHFEFEKLPANPIRGEGWFVDPTASHYNTGFTAIMGGVPYKVDTSHMHGELSDKLASFIRNVRIVAEFELGELNIPPSREEIRYDDKSIAALVDKCTIIQATLIEQVEKRVEEFEHLTAWDAYANITQKVAVDSLRVRPGNLDQFIDINAVSNKLLADFMRTNGNIKGNVQDWKRFSLRYYQRPSVNAISLNRFRTASEWSIAPTPKTRLVIMDVAKAGSKRAFHWWRHQDQLGLDRVWMIYPNDFKSDCTAKDDELNEIIESFGSPENVIRVSEMEEVTAVRGQARVASGTYFKSAGMKGYGHRSRAAFKHVDPSDVPTEGLYFLLSRGVTPHIGLNTSSPRPGWGSNFTKKLTEMLDMINAVKGTTYTVDDVYGITGPQCRSDANKNPKWTSVFELAKECLVSYTSAITATRRRCTTDIGCFSSRFAYSDELLNIVQDQLEETSPLRVALEAARVDSDASIKLAPFSSTAFEIDMSINTRETRAFGNIPDEESYLGAVDLNERYPLLSLLSYSSDNEAHVQDIMDYINLIDGKKND